MPDDCKLKLFVVPIQTEILVLAETQEDAEDHADEALKELDKMSVGPALPMVCLPGDWDLNSIPYGERAADNPDRTIGEWIQLGAAPDYKQPKQDK